MNTTLQHKRPFLHIHVVALQMVVDVHDFTGGDVKVKVVDEKELVVEGRVEKTGDRGSSVSIHTFRRRFALPSQTDVNAISSAISSDGILTITAPKLVGPLKMFRAESYYEVS